MGYAKEKAKTERKLFRIKLVLVIIVFAIVLALCVLGMVYKPQTWKYYFGLPKLEKRGVGELRVHFLDVGEGDCTIIELPDGRFVMIDGGTQEESSKTAIMRYLNALKIDKIDKLLVSSTNSEHCGGLKTILENKEITETYLPFSFQSEHKEYASFYAELLKSNAVIKTASRGEKIFAQEGLSYTLSCLYPYSQSIENETENSDEGVFWLEYQGVSVLLTSDISEETERVLLRDDKLGLLQENGADLTSVEILKVPNHGNENFSSAEFLKYTGVKTAVIS